MQIQFRFSLLFGLWAVCVAGCNPKPAVPKPPVSAGRPVSAPDSPGAVPGNFATAPGGIPVWSEYWENQPVTVEFLFVGLPGWEARLREGGAQMGLRAAAEGGSAYLTPAKLRARYESLGARIGFRYAPDYLALTLRCPSAHWKGVVQTAMECLTSPAFDPDEWPVIRDRYAIERLNDSLDTRPRPESVSASLFPDHPYGRSAGGSYARGVTARRDSTRECYGRWLTADKIRVVASGPIEAGELAEQVGQGLAVLSPARTPAPAPKPWPPVTRPFAPDTGRLLPRIAGFLPHPPTLSDREWAAWTLACHLWQDKLEWELCQKKGLSCQSGFLQPPVARPYTLGWWVTDAPRPAWKSLRNLTEQLLQRGFPPEEIAAKRATLPMKDQWQDQTTAGRTARMADAWAAQRPALAATDGGLFRQPSDFEVLQAFRKFVPQIQWTYRGPPDRFDPELLAPITLPIAEKGK